MANGLWVAYFGGMTGASNVEQQRILGQSLLQMGGVSNSTVEVHSAMDLSGAYLVKVDPSLNQTQVVNTLQTVPGFTHVEDYIAQDPATLRKIQPAAARSQNLYGPFDYDTYLSQLKNNGGDNGGTVDGDPYDSLGNNNTGSTGTANFTQSETSLVAWGNNVVIGFNDSGSNSGGTNKFTGWARSTDGGATFTDGGTLPTSAIGDAGDPVLARDNTTGRIYFSTLGFSGAGTIQMFRSDDGGATWMAPTNATPGGSSEDKQWHTVDNYAGAGNGNVYMVSRRFGAGPGIYFFKSTDGGATFGPNGGTLIVTGNQGAFVTVAPDHSIQVYWYAGTTIQMRRSTDFGNTFSSPITVASGLVGGTNGDLGLTGLRQGTGTFSGFRSNEFPHAVVNPVSGHIYVTFANNPAGVDKADVFVTVSTDGGTTWSAPTRVNDDATTTDQWQPTLAVTPDGGKLGIFYYSRQEDTANNLYKYYGRVATISGGTLNFAPSFAISDVASLPEFGRDAVVNSVYMGDYDTAVATPGAFHVIWSDNRNDLPGGAPRKDPNVYYEKIALGLAVSTTVPAVGSIQNTQTTVFTVNTSDPVQAGTVDASDFEVNGIPADSVLVNTSTQLIFTFNSSPVTAQGVQTMHIDAGAFLRDPDGNPVFEFNGTFLYDANLMSVVSTNPPFPNGIFTLPGPFTYDVTFSEPINPASVQTTDLVLAGIPGAVVTGAVVLPGNTTVRFTIGGITQEGTLTASIAANAITDSFDNPGSNFSANYGVDIGVVPYPTPLAPKNPLGSLIYDPIASGTVNFAADTDSFLINIDPNQKLTIIVRPTSAGLQPRVDLFDPANFSMGFASAPAPGQITGFQTTTISAGGTYRIQVSSVGGTTGNYTVEVILNAAFELEGNVVGALNNTVATAQDINGSVINLTSTIATASRGAVLGTTDNANYTASAVAFGFENISGTGTVIAGLTGVDDASVSIPIGFSFPFYGTNNTNVFVGSNGSLVFGSANTSFTNTDLTTAPTQAAIMPFWDDLHTAGGVAGSNVFFQVTGVGNDQHLTVQWNNIRFFSGGTAGDTLTFQAQIYVDGRIRFNYLDLASGGAAGNNGASASVGIKAAGTQGPNRLLLAFNNGPNAFVGTGQSTLISPPNPTGDYYAVNFTAGQFANIAATALTASNVTVELRDAADAVLATGAGGFTNVTSMISNYQITTTGTYYVRVGGASNVPYSVVVGNNTAFDGEANDTLATAQPIAGNKGALGAIFASGSTVYTPNVLTFGFEDISSTGTVISALSGQDDASASISIGFNFSFYNTTQNTVFVSSNGLMTFGGGDSSFTNADLTTSPSLAGIAPFWDDLIVSGGANSNVFFQVLGSGSTQRLVVQWNQVSFFSGGTTGDTLTFQAVLYAADGTVRFNYQDLVSGSAAGNNGGSATVGIKAAGTQGPNRVLLGFNVPGGNTFVGTGKSTSLTLPPAEDWYSFYVDANKYLRVDTSTPGDGPGEPQVLLNPDLEVYDPNGNLVAGANLADGRNEIVKILKTTLAGTYRARVRAEGGSTGVYFMGVNIANAGRVTSVSAISTSPSTSGGQLVPSLLTSSSGKSSSALLTSSSTLSKKTAQSKAMTDALLATAARKTGGLDQKALAHFFVQKNKPSVSDAALAVSLADQAMLKITRTLA
ncbi:MAG: exo-alpha-sialidase [Planctomycetia bacterium]|nr:exo-alpha-sialidase [Planctomycetia bacterium]